MAVVRTDVRSKTAVLTIVRTIPAGHVATFDAIAAKLHIAPPLVATLIGHLSEDEREAYPWHRVVAKGGAIGRGLHRDEQFAKLVREGVIVSPAGVVQDSGRVCLATFDDTKGGNSSSPAAQHPAPFAPVSRSRGMKDQPR